MIKRHCDLCENEMTPGLTLSRVQNGRRLATVIEHADVRLSVEVVAGINGMWNDGDVCKHCVLDALYTLDNRRQTA